MRQAGEGKHTRTLTHRLTGKREKIGCTGDGDCDGDAMATGAIYVTAAKARWCARACLAGRAREEDRAREEGTESAEQRSKREGVVTPTLFPFPEPYTLNPKP
jgi:hypothetical protein